jgi:hypothetical protein
MCGRGMSFYPELLYLGLFTDISDRFFAQGAIKLEGEEKSLTADAEAEAEEAHEEKSGEENFS